MLTQKLELIQKKLHAPKGQFNKFGGYNYRSCEDILEAVKSLLDGLVLTINDEIIAVGNRVYVKATATITDGKESVSVSAFAREAESKKGMDEAQVTGSTSSYARKYALNGLLLIDDNKDADTQDNSEKPARASAKAVTADVWDSLPDDEKQFLQSIADQVLAANDAQEALAILNAQHLDVEEKTALWSRLDSKTRSAIKAAQTKQQLSEQA